MSFECLSDCDCLFFFGVLNIAGLYWDIGTLIGAILG